MNKKTFNLDSANVDDAASIYLVSYCASRSRTAHCRATEPFKTPIGLHIAWTDAALVAFYTPEARCRHRVVDPLDHHADKKAFTLVSVQVRDSIYVADRIGIPIGQDFFGGIADNARSCAQIFERAN